MSDIADFLRARLAERRAIAEAAIRAAGSGDWRYDPNNDHVSWVETSEYASPVNRETWWPLVTEAQSHIGDTIDDGIGAFIATNDPGGVLADLDAKLAIVDEAIRHQAVIDGEWGCSHSADAISAGLCPEQQPSDSKILRLLAQPFAGHPDHKGEEWAP